MPKFLSQLRAGPEQEAFHGGKGQFQDLSNLVVGKILVAAKDDGQTLLLGEGCDRAVHGLLKLLLNGGLIRMVRAIGRDLPVLAAFLLFLKGECRFALTAADFVEYEIASDGEEPGGELCRWLIAGSGFPDPQEHLLSQVFRIGRIPQHLGHRAHDGVLVDGHELGEGRMVAASDPHHQIDAAAVQSLGIRQFGERRGARRGSGFAIEGIHERYVRNEEWLRVEGGRACVNRDRDHGTVRLLRTEEIITMVQKRAPLKDYAFLKTDSGQMICGLGPFRSRADPPPSGVAFYVNDFRLGESQPWKVPHSWSMSPDLRNLKAFCNGAAPPRVEWRQPEEGRFAAIYARIKDEIGRGGFQKSVPVLTEQGVLRSGEWEGLLRRVENLPASFFSYGCRLGDWGLLGASPELLVSVHGRHLETMALAGTVECGEIDRFQSDPKEISEHELVAEYLCRKLAGIGAVKREPRGALRLGPIAHFLSVIHVELDEHPDLNVLVRFLHPTPALGALPRNELTLALLHGYREELETPGWFGAPFGAWVDGAFHAVVAIRNIIWDGERALLAAGCGVIEASLLENEWRELALKRSAVKLMLGL